MDNSALVSTTSEHRRSIDVVNEVFVACEYFHVIPWLDCVRMKICIRLKRQAVASEASTVAVKKFLPAWVCVRAGGQGRFTLN